MEFNNLTAVSPIDGRYHQKTNVLAKYFSEFALIKYRVKIEIKYFIELFQIPLPQLKNLDANFIKELHKIYEEFSINDAKQIKEIEQTTNHDVKAVEYFIKNKFKSLGLEKYQEFIHFGLTSQDINNTAVPLSYKDFLNSIFCNEIKLLINQIKELAEEWKEIPILAHTHGQPASPTRLGKELLVFVERLENQLQHLKAIPTAAKFGGATGNFNAHQVAYPSINWKNFANNFVENTLGLKRYEHTTQIEHYDNLAAQFDAQKRLNNILIDFARDIWTYISMNYFKQKLKKGEVGSSTMPHKINPIDFENAEGNLGLANALFEHLSAKLPISRLQRDLTDSTVLRNIGVPEGHCLIALKSLKKGLGKLLINKEKIKEDLDNNWAVVGEAIQTILRRESYPNPYEALKDLTRNNQKITPETLAKFIENLDLNESIKRELKAITPFNYVGVV